MIRIFKRLPGVIFMVLLLGLAGKEALSHQRTYSPVEKRELQTRPEISITKVLDGRFQKKYESYLRDQFPGRDHWVSFQTDMELFMGKNEIHNVYIGKNHYLLEHYTEKEFDPQQISKNLQALEKFVGKAKQNADVHVMMVPTKSWVLREKLPAFAPHYKEQKFYDALHIKRKKFITGQTITGRRWEHGMPMNNTQRRLVEIFRGHMGKRSSVASVKISMEQLMQK